MRKAMDIAGYDELRREQAEKRARGELMGIGVSFFTEAVGAGPAQAHGHPRPRHGRRRRAARAPDRQGGAAASACRRQGQGHETTFAQIVAEELGIPPEDIEVVHGDTDHTPFGLGTYGSRSTPVSGAATALVARKVREQGAARSPPAMLEASPDDLEWEKGRWFVKGDPEQGKTIQEIAHGRARHGRAARGRRGRPRRRSASTTRRT